MRAQSISFLGSSLCPPLSTLSTYVWDFWRIPLKNLSVVYSVVNRTSSFGPHINANCQFKNIQDLSQNSANTHFRNTQRPWLKKECRYSLALLACRPYHQGMDLFSAQDSLSRMGSNQPLPERLRPQSFAEFVGQTSALGENSPLRRQIEEKAEVPNLILLGAAWHGKDDIQSLACKIRQGPILGSQRSRYRR
ncbi:MAG: hypothetical protein IPK68_21055 [Bdellovibrionales bacterium]|nr:hypothetical protein [Bdellovibrionales bacterium]